MSGQTFFSPVLIFSYVSQLEYEFYQVNLWLAICTYGSMRPVSITNSCSSRLKLSFTGLLCVQEHNIFYEFRLVTAELYGPIP